MTWHDLALLTGHIYIATGFIIRGLRGDKSTATISTAIGVLFLGLGILARRGLI